MIFIKNDAYLKSDTSIAGDERYTPYYAVMPLLEFMPSPQPHYKIWCPFDEIGQHSYNVCARQGTQ